LEHIRLVSDIKEKNYKFNREARDYLLSVRMRTILSTGYIYQVSVPEKNEIMEN